MLQVEGTCNGRFGYVVAVSQILSVSPVSSDHSMHLTCDAPHISYQAEVHPNEGSMRTQ